jgi:hypothetical protein
MCVVLVPGYVESVAPFDTSEMTLSEKLALASRLQRVRYVEEQRRLVEQANAAMRHVPADVPATPVPDGGSDSVITQLIEDAAQIDLEALIGSTDEPVRGHVCIECGSSLAVPLRGQLPKFCGPTCRKRAFRRRRSRR